MFTFVTSCCSPAFPPQYKRAPVFALYGMQVVCTECFSQNASEFYALPQSQRVGGQRSQTTGSILTVGNVQRSEPIRSLHSV